MGFADDCRALELLMAEFGNARQNSEQEERRLGKTIMTGCNK
jgi:hypothetical protein